MSILKEVWAKESTAPEVKCIISMSLSYRRDYKIRVQLRSKS